MAAKRQSRIAVNVIINVWDGKHPVATLSCSDQDFVDFLVKACDEEGYQTTKVPPDKEHK